MVKTSSGKTGMRSFKVVDARKANGAPTKFDADSRYVNRTPAQAARKAGFDLCNRKRISGRCVFLIRVQETTQGSNNKVYDYTFKRIRLDEPIVVGDRKYFYTAKVYSEKNSTKFSKTVKSSKSSGRMLKKSLRTNTVESSAPEYKKLKKTKKAKKSKKATKSKSILEQIFS